MKRRTKLKLLIYMLAAACLLLLCSCNNAAELQEISIVMGMAIDIDEEDAERPIRLTVEVANYQNLSAKSADSQANDSIFSVSGATVMEAMGRLNNVLDKAVFWGHNKLIIFGKSVLERGINDYIDAFLRDNEMPINVFIVAAQDKAADIFGGECGISVIISGGIAEFFNKYERQEHSYKLGCSVSNYCEKMLYEYPAAVIPVIALKDKEQSASSTGEEKAAPQIYLASYMLLDGRGKSVGLLDEEEELGMCLWRGKLKTALISLRDGDSSYSLMIYRPRARLSYDDGIFAIDVSVEGELLEAGSAAAQITALDVSAITAMLQQRIEDMLRRAFEKARESDLDYLGLGEYLYRHHRLRAEDMPDFPAALKEPRINVEIKPINIGDLYYAL